MGLFTKRTTDKEWLEMVAPFCLQFRELNSEFSGIFLNSSTDIIPMSRHLDKLRSVANQIKRLPTPKSHAADQAKGDYDAILSAVIKLKDFEAQNKVFVNVGRQTNHVNINDLNKIENQQRQRDGLQDMISVKAMEISQYLNDHFEDGDVPFGLLSSR